ncbi:Putative primase [Nosema bombycis CQ1]|uniref:Putative primase n=1 Tax=Nosema bombycis (strain CQ1 / CVCC 102059) TaxID=578461 RepID=R0MLM3_NOSB1|nr:Putative primase [Nosema bombycis CQ1]|eukprot:EOB13733.1 Putative primase [Nosema bombycis CQ1]
MENLYLLLYSCIHLDLFNASLPSSFFSIDSNTTGSANPMLVSLKDKRVGIVSETGHRDYKTEMIKNLTGRDEIASRNLYSNYIQTFSISTKFIVLTNHIPTFTFNDEALWRRIVVLHFNNKFVNKTNKKPGEKSADPPLRTILEKV